MYQEARIPFTMPVDYPVCLASYGEMRREMAARTARLINLLFLSLCLHRCQAHLQVPLSPLYAILSKFRETWLVFSKDLLIVFVYIQSDRNGKLIFSLLIVLGVDQFVLVSKEVKFPVIMGWLKSTDRIVKYALKINHMFIHKEKHWNNLNQANNSRWDVWWDVKLVDRL